MAFSAPLKSEVLDAIMHAPSFIEPAATDSNSRNSSSSSSDMPEQQFLLVLMEVLAIETSLLLNDALNPEVAVPRANISMPARTAASAAPSSSGLGRQQQQQQWHWKESQGEC